MDDSKGNEADISLEEMPVKKGQIIEEIANPEVMEQDFDEDESARGRERAEHDVLSVAGSEANGRNITFVSGKLP